MKVFGQDLRWADTPKPMETRQLEEVTALDIAFAAAFDAISGERDYSIAAVYNAINFLTDTVAALPIRQIDTATNVADSVNPPVLEVPNPFESRNSTLTKVMGNLLFHGNAYLWVRTRDNEGNVTAVYVVDSQEVTVSWDARRLYPVYRWRGDVMSPQQFIHIPLNFFDDGLKGVGPVTAARLSLTGIKAQDNMARRISEDQAVPSGVLKVAGKLNPGEAALILEQWETAHAGRARPAVLDGGLEWQPLSFSPVDAQFLESQLFSVAQVGRWFRLNPWWLGLDAGNSITYSTSEGLYRQLVTSTLSPTYLEKIAAAFSTLLPRGKHAEFDSSELLKADMVARYSAYQVGLDAGFITIPEVRQLENMAPNSAAVRPALTTVSDNA